MLRDLFYSHPYLVYLLSFTLCYIMMPIVYQIAKEKNFVVHPNKRSSHTSDIPNIGGMAICVSFLIIFTIFDFSIIPEFQFLLLGMLIIFFVGIVDDILVLSPLEKLIGESISGFCLICLANIRITNLCGVFDLYDLPLLPSYLLSLFILLALTNSINLIDGVDGLASGHGMLYCLFYGCYFALVSDTAWAIMAICLMGSMSVYFIYNVFGRKKIFMGDSGSLFLGYVLTAIIIHFIELNNGSYQTNYQIANAPFVCLCTTIVPIYDMVRVAIIRMHNNKSPFLPDKNHIHHLLLQNNFSHVQITCILLFISVIFILLGFLFRNISMFISFSLITVLYYSLTYLLVRLTKNHHA